MPLPYAVSVMNPRAPLAALFALLIGGPALPGTTGAAEGASGAAAAGSPLSFLRGVELAYGFGTLDYEQAAGDSSGRFQADGRRFTLRALVRVPAERTWLAAEYAGLSAGADVETVEHAGGVSRSVLDPEITRMRVGLTHERTLGSRGGALRGTAGWRWLRDELVRTRFSLNGGPAPGTPEFASENFRWGGVTLGLGATVPLGRPRSGDFGWRLVAGAELAPSLRGEVTDASGGRFDLGGDALAIEAGLEWGGARHGLSLTFSRDRASFEDTGPTATPSGPRRMGPAEFRSTLVQLGGRALF